MRWRQRIRIPAATPSVWPDLARHIALEAGLERSAAETIAQAGLLHDLGKIGVPEGILRKPGPLSDGSGRSCGAIR